jgi:flagellar biogenesis protein FliO
MTLSPFTKACINNAKKPLVYAAVALSTMISTNAFADTQAPIKIEQQLTEPQEPGPLPSPPQGHEENKDGAAAPSVPTYGTTVMKMILTLAGLLGLAAGSLWMVRKMTQGRLGSFGKKQIQILEKRPLSPKTLLYVVEFAGKQHLIAESQLEVKMLSSVEIASEEN